MQATKLIGVSIVLLITVVVYNNCSTPNGLDSGNTTNSAKISCFQQLGTNNEWSGEVEVAIDGYSGNAMEPKPSADQVVLFWNDKPASDDAMDIHYAVKQTGGRYLYIGVLPGTAAPSHLDGVPSIDSAGNFYFVSTRSYTSNYQTVFAGQIGVLVPNSLQVTAVASADTNVSAKTNGILDMDIDISWDGTQMIASRASFSGGPIPDASHLELFNVGSRSASLNANSATLLKEVNLPECRIYAGSLSRDNKELFYTILPGTGTPSLSDFRIVVAKRDSVSEPFGKGQVITGIQGQSIEGPAPSYDDGGKTLFYHRFDPSVGRYKIYKVTRP